MEDDRIIKEPTLLLQPKDNKVTITIRIARIDEEVEKTGRFAFPFPNELRAQRVIDLPDDCSMVSITVS